MPYIPEKDRGNYNIYIRNITNIVNRVEKKRGHLNYIITKILLDTMPLSCFDDFLDISVQLRKIEHEIERRLQDPYEDKKIKENGDIWNFIKGKDEESRIDEKN